MKNLNINTNMSATENISVEVMDYVKSTFAGYENVNSSLVSFGEAVSVLKNCIQIIRIKLSNTKDNNLRLVLGQLNSFKMEIEEIID